MSLDIGIDVDVVENGVDVVENGVDVVENGVDDVDLYVSSINISEMSSKDIFDLLSKNNYKDIVEKIGLDNFTYCIDRQIKQNDPIAMNNLGFVYIKIFNDYEMGMYWFKRSAELGFLEGILNLAHRFFNDKDYKQAIIYYTKATELGCVKSMNWLGLIYDECKYYDKAIYWYLKASDLGNNVAMWNLGYLYYYDIKDYEKAIYWFTKASELGNTDAKEMLKEIIMPNVYQNIMEDDCHICYVKLKYRRVIVLLCGHVFHYGCLSNMTTCPVCRATIADT